MFGDAYRGKSVWLSGHTGFKGSWLATWLLRLGAEVHGFALEPPTNPNMFTQIGLASDLHHEIGDIRDRAAVARSINNAKPDFVFHLAAQPLVRYSFDQPVETYEVNVIGTVHVLDALRSYNRPCASVFVTTDKCYENREWLYSYREEDPLGGYDPYSSSKAAAEIAISAYRRSFFQSHPVKLASARAGNVIGGGDWAIDRIVPDSIRSLERGEPISVRNKTSTRPWQHVLEPLSGYLTLASQMSANPKLASAYNFGPSLNSNQSVAGLVEEVIKNWSGEWLDQSDPNAVHEAQLLNLATDKAFHILGWSSVWNFEESVAATVKWYLEAQSKPENTRNLTEQQVAAYQCRAAENGLAWATP